MGKKFKIIYSKKLMEFLTSQGFGVLEVVPNKHKQGFLAWKFEVTQEFLEAVNLYNSNAMNFVEVCKFIAEQALQGNLFTLRDLTDGKKKEQDCVYRVNTYKKLIIKT